MRSFTPGRRLGLAVAVTLLLASGSACSSDVETEPSAGPTPSASPAPTASATSQSATPAPGPSKTPSQTLPPPASTAVPPPTPGNVESTVESQPEESKKPVKLDKPSKTGTGLSAELVRIRAIEAEAQLPGEIAGPALAITIEISNSGDQAADLSTVVVTLLNSDDAPGNEMSATPAKPFTGTLDPGDQVRGTYVFTVAKSKRNPITLNVTIGEAPVLVFTGDAR